MVEQRRQFTVVRAARWGQEPSCGGTGLRPCRERLARSVRPHHRSRPAAANCPPRPRARGRYCQLDKYHLLILDDLAYVTKDQAETSVLFELISARYERRSLLITANQPFGEWGKIFPDQAMTVAVVDRLVHHATIFEMNVESYRRRAALERKRGRGRPPTHVTITANA